MKKGRLKNILFCAVAFAFTVLSLFGYLVNSIKLQRESGELEEALSRNIRQKEEIDILRVEYDNSLSLAELEEYALGKLKLQKCQPEQIIYLTEDKG